MRCDHRPVGDTLSFVFTGVFGLISSVGVVYQIIDIRQRAARDVAQAHRMAYPGYPAVGYSGAAPAQHPVYGPHPPPAVPPPFVAPPVAGAPRHGVGMPLLPRTVTWARVLIAFSTLAIGLLWVTFGADTFFGDVRTEGVAVELVAVGYGLFLLLWPSVLWPTACSILLGRGYGGARYPTIILCLIQVGLYGWGGIDTYIDPGSAGLVVFNSSVAIDAISILALLPAVASLVAVILLVAPRSSSYFRAARTLRRATASFPATTTRQLA
jgi:hypothetical protein